MPAVVAFGRRWACGTDDFVFPGLLDTTVKSCWLLSALLVYYQMDLGDFPNRDQFKTYLMGMMTSLVIIILTDLVAVNRSAKGSIMDTHLRKCIVPIIYLRLFWEALDTGWNTVGTLWVFGSTFSPLQVQDPPSFYFIRRYIICNWVSLIVLALYFAFLYDPMGKIGEDSHQAYSQTQSLFWAKKLKTYSAILNWDFSQTEDKVFEGVGRTFSSILKETNFVSSDAAAGLFALYRLEEDTQQVTVGESGKGNVEQHAPVKAESLVSPSIVDGILKLEKYFPCTSGRRNWANQLVDPHRHRLSRMLNFVKTCKGSSDITETEANGFCSRCKMSTLINLWGTSGIKETDVVHLSLTANYEEFPFCIFLDHNSKSIVLTVVGHFSATSIVTYLDSLSVPLTSMTGDASNSGGCQGLQRVSAKLREKSFGVLETLKKTYPEYNLVLIGQSFGAGVAAMLGISLISEFPGLRVLCLNPPGGLLSAEMAKLSEGFITSITFGTDLFSRISLPALLSLKQGVIDVIYGCKIPKYKLLMGILLRLIGFKLKIKMSPTLDSKTPKGYDNEAQSTTVTVTGSTHYQEPNSGISTQTHASTPTFMPGKILGIKTNSCRNNRREACRKEFEIQWVDSRDFSKIKLLPGMLTNHYKSHAKIIRALKDYQES